MNLFSMLAAILIFLAVVAALSRLLDVSKDAHGNPVSPGAALVPDTITRGFTALSNVFTGVFNQ